jgi:hypothetical protein
LGLRYGLLFRGSMWGSCTGPRQAKSRWGSSDWGEHLSSSEKTPENLEGLTEKVGTLGPQVSRRNRCGAAKKWARRARLAEAPTGDSASDQLWST